MMGRVFAVHMNTPRVGAFVHYVAAPNTLAARLLALLGARRMGLPNCTISRVERA